MVTERLLTLVRFFSCSASSRFDCPSRKAGTGSRPGIPSHVRSAGVAIGAFANRRTAGQLVALAPSWQRICPAGVSDLAANPLGGTSWTVETAGKYHAKTMEVQIMKRRVLSSTLVMVFLLVAISIAHAATEYVTVVKVMDADDNAIIERSNGEQWLIQKGIGAMSLWRYEGKKVIVYSPGIFCGIGSYLIIPDRDQKARIWEAELISSGTSVPAVPLPIPPRAAPGSALGWIPPRITDLFTADEMNKAGLSKLSPSEIDALNAAVARALLSRTLLQPPPPSQPSTDEVDLHDSGGQPVAYISLKDDLTINVWSGTPVAYLDGDSVYGFNGKHLGWFRNGLIYDQEGEIVVATRERLGGRATQGSPKALRQLKPLKGLKELKPLRPLFLLSWSETPAIIFFMRGAQ